MTANMKLPCVVDIKMGWQTYEPTATEEKKQNEAVSIHAAVN